MSDSIEPKIREYENAGWHDNMQGKPCRYESLKAAGSAYAEDYLRGWNEVTAMDDDLLKNGFRDAA